MIHYHGTPLTPNAVMQTIAGRNFCVSYARPDQIEMAHVIGQSVLLDNGAFSVWRKVQAGDVLPERLQPVAQGDWSGYYEWCERWLEYWTTWAAIPDVIAGSAQENDRLIEEWPFGSRGAPVWHLHEPIERLLVLAKSWPRVCLGSSAQYAEIGSVFWHRRMTEAMDSLCGDGPPPCWLHMLRGMSLSRSQYPFASVDSTDVARNHNRASNTALTLANRWDSMQNPSRWHIRGKQLGLLDGV